MAEQKPELPHKVALDERNRLTMTGVTEVVSFDEDSVVAHTSLGTVVVEGSHLKLKNLSPEGGQVAIDGRISALIYQENRPQQSFWRRLLG